MNDWQISVPSNDTDTDTHRQTDAQRDRERVASMRG